MYPSGEEYIPGLGRGPVGVTKARSAARRTSASGFRGGFALAVAIAFVVKAIGLAQLYNHPRLQPQGELDTTTYVELARTVAAGGPLAVKEPFFVSPLYVFFLAAIFKAGGSLAARRGIRIL